MELTKNDLDILVWGLDLLIERSRHCRENLEEMDDKILTIESYNTIEYMAVNLKNRMVDQGRIQMIGINEKIEKSNDTSHLSTS